MSNTDVTIISIHALREEGDFTGNEVVRDSRYFYPRPPRGGRPSPGTVCLYAVIFLSTPSARRATYELKLLGIDTVISIHALREEGDRPSGGCIHRGTYFYPRPPRGGRPLDWGAYRKTQKISIHALREEGDVTADGGFDAREIFLSTPSARRATFFALL